MKRLLLSLSFIICQLSFSVAQTGLKINELFEGRIIPQEKMVETRVRGKTLAKYQLTYYRSVRLVVAKEEDYADYTDYFDYTDYNNRQK